MLAVRPFANMTGDASQEYLADGMTEETTSNLSSVVVGRIGVISRIFAMTYKGSNKNVGQIGRELAVYYVLECSVRCVGDWADEQRQIPGAGPRYYVNSPILSRATIRNTVRLAGVWSEPLPGVFIRSIHLSVLAIFTRSVLTTCPSLSITWSR